MIYSFKTLKTEKNGEKNEIFEIPRSSSFTTNTERIQNNKNSIKDRVSKFSFSIDFGEKFLQEIMNHQESVYN